MDDLKLIKRHYGEDMMHLCRELFPTILEEEGTLYTILSEIYAPNKFLCQDIKNFRDGIYRFKDYIYSIYYSKSESDEKKPVGKTPYELLREVGYTLYECKKEADIQSFRHFYKRSDGKTQVYTEGEAPMSYDGEELCTFNGGRLGAYFVFFAVRDDAKKLNREDFIGKEERQDEYGTSVISIQFCKNGRNTVSIKNRYNHTVRFPDATYENNLNNIVYGLTEAFEREYGLNLTNSDKSVSFELDGYVMASDGIYYKFNYEINNIYYCPNNIVIHNGKVIKYDESRFLVFDKYILDMQKKRITPLDRSSNITLASLNAANDFAKDWGFMMTEFDDSFTYGLNLSGEGIKSIKVIKNEDKTKTITINGDIEIVIDKTNKMIKYKNPHLTTIEDDFLKDADYLREIDLPNVTDIGNGFLRKNGNLIRLNLPNVKRIKSNFLEKNHDLEEIDLPNVEDIGQFFMHHNSSVHSISAPKLRTVSNGFLSHNNSLRTISLPELIKTGVEFLMCNENLEVIDLPKLEELGTVSLNSTSKIKEFNMPALKIIGNGCLSYYNLKTISLPNVEEIGLNFMGYAKEIEEVIMPKLKMIGTYFLSLASNIKRIDLPSVEEIGSNFMDNAEEIEEVIMPKARKIGKCFMKKSYKIKEINLPKAEEIGPFFMMSAKPERIILPSLNMDLEEFENRYQLLFIPYIELKDCIIKKALTDEEKEQSDGHGRIIIYKDEIEEEHKIK